MKTLHIVTGQPAAGKTTWATQLAAELNGCFLDTDITYEPVVQAGLLFAGHDPDDRDSPSYKRAFRLPIYEALFMTAQANLPHTHVVIAGPFTQELQYPQWHQQLVKHFRCEVTIYWLTCSSDTVKARMQKRNEKRDKAKLADWQNYQQTFINNPEPRCRYKRVETE